MKSCLFILFITRIITQDKNTSALKGEPQLLSMCVLLFVKLNKSTFVVTFSLFSPYCYVYVNLISCIISTYEDPGLRIESFPIINLRGVFTKLN